MTDNDVQVPIEPDAPVPFASEEQGDVKQDDNKTARYRNYTKRQKEWMFAAIVAAKCALGTPMNNRLELRTLDFAISKLEDWKSFTTIPQTPSPNAMRGLWKRAWKPESPAKNTKLGRRRLDIDFDIQTSLALNPEATLRSISREVGASKTTVMRRIQDMEKEERRMRARNNPKKQKKPKKNSTQSVSQASMSIPAESAQ